MTLLLTGAHCSGYESRHRPDTDVADPAIDRESDPPDGGGSDAGELVDLYQACNGYSDRCLELNSNCSGYTQNAASSFCAKMCETDEECPTLSGFKAGCNFAWCAVLCDDGECPDGMECVRDVGFIDRDGESRGPRDVCVIAP